jgi:hypothetical protein
MTVEYGQTQDMLEGDDEDDESYIFCGRGKRVNTYVDFFFFCRQRDHYILFSHFPKKMDRL